MIGSPGIKLPEPISEAAYRPGAYMGSRSLLTLLLFLLCISAAAPAHSQQADELIDRRTRLSEALPSGIIILPGHVDAKEMEQPGWIQEPSFQYFTGLNTIPGSVLVMDTAANHHVLFASGTPSSFGIALDSLNLLARPDLIEASGLDAVLSMDRFIPWVSSRLDRLGPSPVIFLNEPRRPQEPTLPAEMPPVAGWNALWKHSLSTTFPDAEFRSAAPVITEMRWQKSDFEVSHLRHNGRASAAALKAGMVAINPDRTQRYAEAAVVAACLEEGAEGPSFWPWVMTGPNAHLASVVRSFYDYQHLNRPFVNGQLVRVDIGCMSGGYGGDVGRTVPVSGQFTMEQGRIWDLLILGYRAGVSAMRPGATLAEIAQASHQAILTQRGVSPEHDALVDMMTSDPGVAWHIHGVGIESGENPGNTLKQGTVLAYEPMISIGNNAYYLEDMWLITETGAENLTPGLPTSRQEIESFLRR